MIQPLDLHRSLRADLAPADLVALRAAVRAHYESLVTLQEAQELLAVDLAELLCTGLELLIDLAPSLAPDARADVVGAARYFISAQDAVPDDRACVGLDDDVLVFNYVAASLGRADLEIAE